MRTNSAMSNIKISRDSGWVDRFRIYQVLLNENVIGEIADGETKTYSVDAGSHELQLKIDWTTSNAVKIDLEPDAEISLHCGSNVRGMKAFLILFYITIFAKSYIWLQVDDN